MSYKAVRFLKLLRKSNLKSLATSSYRNYCNEVKQETKMDRFRAALLYPNRENLKIETLTNNECMENGFIRIGVDYCRISNWDVRYIKESENIDLPFIPGSEFSGEIIEVNDKQLSRFKPGDQVMVILDDIKLGGGLSQQCLVSEKMCIPLNNRINAKDLFSILSRYGNAHLAFSQYSKINDQEIVIVIAGPGGEGLAAAEMAAKLYNAKVFVIFDSIDVKTLARDESVYRAINAHVGLTKVYTFLNGGLKNEKAKIVYDTVGTSIIHVVSDFVDPNGHIFTTSPFFNPKNFIRPYFKKNTSNKNTNTYESTKEPNDILKRAQAINISTLLSKNRILFDKITQEIIDMFNSGTVAPYPSTIYSLSEVNKAINFIYGNKSLCDVFIDLKRKKINENKN